MIKKIIELLNRIKVSITCCYKSSCSLNDDFKNIPYNIDEEELKDSAVDERAAF